MNKALLALIAAATLLTACNSTAAEDSNGVKEQPSVQTQAKQDDSVPGAAEKNNEDPGSAQEEMNNEDKEPAQEESNQEDKESVTEETNHEAEDSAIERGNQDKWSALPEYDTIMQNIDLKETAFRTVTDNPGKRILLISDENGREKYKSIFIKKTNYLKIINIDGEGQIFHGALK